MLEPAVSYLRPALATFSYNKSAHTALAVKACLLGCKTATLNAQVPFVKMAVAISALAGEARTISHRTRNWAVFALFLGDGSQKGMEMEFCVVFRTKMK